MTPDEIARLLDVCPAYRRLLYETAFLTGLRVNELRHLTIDHLDDVRGGSRLDADWTKTLTPRGSRNGRREENSTSTPAEQLT